MRLCVTALQEPHRGWLQGRAQRIWERFLGAGADPSLTHVPLLLYLNTLTLLDTLSLHKQE